MYSYYIGLNDRYTNNQVMSIKAAKKFIADTMRLYSMDCTIMTAQGIYKSSPTENTIIIQTLNKPISGNILNIFLFILNQESILKTIQEVQSEFMTR